MKTITKEVPRLMITHHEYAESPRQADVNIGYFFTKQNRYLSPDGTDHELYDYMLEGEGHVSSTEEHMEYIKLHAKRDYDIDVVHITPVYCYEHGNVVYKRGTANGFDVSNCGFYIVTAETAKKMNVDLSDIDAMNIYIDGELEKYTKYCNGEVYEYVLLDDNGEAEDRDGNFYDLDAIKHALPDEWKDQNMEDYLRY